MQTLQLKISLHVYIFALAYCSSPDLANGHITAETGIKYIGANSTFICLRGFILNVPSIAFCIAAGTWSTIPTCDPSGNLLYFISVWMPVCLE